MLEPSQAGCTGGRHHAGVVEAGSAIGEAASTDAMAAGKEEERCSREEEDSAEKKEREEEANKKGESVRYENGQPVNDTKGAYAASIHKPLLLITPSDSNGYQRSASPVKPTCRLGNHLVSSIAPVRQPKSTSPLAGLIQQDRKSQIDIVLSSGQGSRKKVEPSELEQVDATGTPTFFVLYFYTIRTAEKKFRAQRAYSTQHYSSHETIQERINRFDTLMRIFLCLAV
ncbi:unnamed protein product [Protopolystoma xenopodis]|uniref:Uncharacterized protein n=1 Tax=Protopolystoma xenopodis TaxID=117903 RepID=A0A3S5BMZ5_9PLAT|nr:unnamed protein product [Protopolystoma xenopodis]